MKRSLFVVLLFCFVSHVSLKEACALDSMNFINNLYNCTNYTPNHASADGQILGQVNGACHVKYFGRTLRDTYTNETLLLNECYFPMGEIQAMAQNKNKIFLFMNRIFNGGDATEAEKEQMKAILREDFNTHRRYCR